MLAVKDNQPTLFAAITGLFAQHLERDFKKVRHRHHATNEKGHGRVEQRDYYLVPVPKDFAPQAEWPGLKALGLAISTTVRDGRETIESRFYILSRYLSGERFAEACRSHWSIENNLHWQLDVTFREDTLRVREGHAPANLSLIMRTALSRLKNDKTLRRSLATKRLTAGWNEHYLEQLLRGA